MMTSIGPADLLKYHSGLKNTDIQNWKQIPASAAVELPAEVKALVAASDALEKRLKAQHDAQVAADPVGHLEKPRQIGGDLIHWVIDLRWIGEGE